MVKYRPHKGSLKEVMNFYIEFDSKETMIDFICKDYDYMFNPSDVVISDSQGEDERIGWKSWRYVCIKRYGDDDFIAKYGVPQCIGMCDLGEKDEHTKL